MPFAFANEELLAQVKDDPMVKAGMFGNIEQTLILLEKEFSHISRAAKPSDVAVVYEGSATNAVEKGLVSYIETRYPFTKGLEKQSDDVDLNEVLQTSKMVILLGGPSQNKITEQLFEKDLLQKKEHPSDKTLALYEGKTNTGSKILVVSDVRGFENVRRVGPSRSPLAKVMPTEAVVATASFLSLLLAALWLKIGGAVRVLLARLITMKRKEKVDMHHVARAFHLGKIQIKYREFFAILAAALAYATGVTLALTGLGYPFWDVFKLSIIGGIIFYGVREFGRIIICYAKDIHTEYTLWWPGAIFAVLTGFLGNTLNTPGVVIEHKDKEVKFSRYTPVKYGIVFGTMVAAVVLFIVNIISPSKGIHIFAVIASTYATAEIMPFKPMPGKDIAQWRPVLFTFTLILIVCVYVLFNFVI